MKEKVGSSAEPVSRGYYTPEELAEFLAISKSTVYRMVYQGILPAYKIKGVLRFDRNEVKQFIQAGRIGPMIIV